MAAFPRRERDRRERDRKTEKDGEREKDRKKGREKERKREDVCLIARVEREIQRNEVREGR